MFANVHIDLAVEGRAIVESVAGASAAARVEATVEGQALDARPLHIYSWSPATAPHQRLVQDYVRVRA